MNRRRLVALGVAAALGSLEANLVSAGIVNINPSKDNTLYEYDPLDGDRSNALGFHFFAGETGMNELRRGVLAFDIAGNVPSGSTITAVSLSVNMSRTPTNTAYGAPATPNDVTWRHRFFDTIFWSAEGGDFSATVSASQLVSTVGQYTWSSAQMVADVQAWLDNPAGNFGWVMLGDETTIATAKRFDTRESASPPMLTIEFTPAPRVAPSPRPRPSPAPRP